MAAEWAAGVSRGLRVRGGEAAGLDADASAFDDVVARLRESDAPLFVQLVTMQNHIPYEGRYEHPIPVRGPDGGPLPPTGQYLRGLWHSDRALQALVRDLRHLPEHSVLVVYGDHLPGTYPGPVRDLNGLPVIQELIAQSRKPEPLKAKDTNQAAGRADSRSTRSRTSGRSVITPSTPSATDRCMSATSLTV